jgi:SAM-dependent methyltransferase
MCQAAESPPSARARLWPSELSPALTGMLAMFVPTDARCLNVGRGNSLTMRAWLVGHGCHHVDVAPRQVTALPLEDELFDAALLIGVLDQLDDLQRATAELCRVLRPGGVLLVSATNGSYWRHRLDRVARVGDPQPGTVSPGSLRRLLLQGGFSLVGVEGQDGAFIRDLPLAGRLWHRRGSGPYRVAERLFRSV